MSSRGWLLAGASVAALIAGAAGPVGSPELPTLAALKALTPGQFPYVTTAGRTAIGDRGGVTFKWSALACPANSGNGDDASEVKAGSGCWLAIFPETGAFVEAFGADPTNTVDSAPGMALATAYACRTGKAIYAGNGTYKLVSAGIAFTCDKDYLAFIGRSYNTIFSYTGTGAIDSIVSIDPGAGNNNWGWIIGPFTVTGNTHSTYGLHTTRLHHSYIDVNARNVVTSGYYGQFGVLNQYRVICSGNEGAYTTQPANCFLGATDGVGGGIYAATAFIIAEGVSGSGIKLSTSNNNLIWGSSEGNARGAELAADTQRNGFQSVDFEANSVEDVLDGGSYNVYEKLVSCCTGRFHLSSTAQGTRVIDGNFDTITVDSVAATAQIVIHPTTVTTATFSGTKPNIDFNGASIAYTPTLGCAAGALTTAAADGNYRRQGKLSFTQIHIGITLNGTCAGTLFAGLPFAGVGGKNSYLVGRDRSVGGNAIVGIVNQGVAQVDLTNYNNTYPGANGSNIDVSGTYVAP